MKLELLNLINEYSGDVAREIGTDTILNIEIDLLGDVGASDNEGYTGYAFRFIQDVDEDFKGQEGDNPTSIKVNGVELMYIGYNL